MAVDKRRKARL